MVIETTCTQYKSHKSRKHKRSKNQSHKQPNTHFTFLCLFYFSPGIKSSEDKQKSMENQLKYFHNHNLNQDINSNS